MKKIKLIISILLITTIALVSCKKDGSTGPGAGGDVVGTWSVNNAVIAWTLTTNSDQTVRNMWDIAGQINIDGTMITMNFMYLENSGTRPSFTIIDATKKYTLMLEGNSGTGSLMNNGELYTGNISYSFDGTTLTINESTIQHITSDATVTISGSLSYNATNLPANTPTQIQIPEDVDYGADFGFASIELNSNGTGTSSTVENGITETENFTYEIDGNLFIFTSQTGEEMVFEYSVTGNTMNWLVSDSGGLCDNLTSETKSDCLAGWEWSFNLDEGSLTDISGMLRLYFLKL